MHILNLTYIRSLLQRLLHPGQLPLEDRNILLFTIDTALQGLMMGGIFNYLSVFIVRLGASKLEASLLTALPALVITVASIPAGQIVQRQSNLVYYTNLVRVFHRGMVLVVALLPFLAPTPAAYPRLVTLIIILWTVKAFSNALLETSWMSAVADVIPADRRARVNGRRWAILSVVTAIAVAIYGIMLDRLPFPLGYQIVFLISFAGGVTGMWFFGHLEVPENLQSDTPGDTPTPVNGPPVLPRHIRIRAYLQSLRVPDFLRYQLTATVLRIGLNLPTALYSVYWIRQLHASDLWIGWQSTTGQIALIAGYFFWARVVSRRGYHIPLLICTVGLGFYPVLTALVPSQEWLPLVSPVQGFFITGINLAFFDTLLGVCPAERRASFFAVNTMLASFTIFIAPLLGSALADLLDIRGVFFIAAAIHVLATVLFWRYRIGAQT